MTWPNHHTILDHKEYRCSLHVCLLRGWSEWGAASACFMANIRVYMEPIYTCGDWLVLWVLGHRRTEYLYGHGASCYQLFQVAMPTHSSFMMSSTWQNLYHQQTINIAAEAWTLSEQRQSDTGHWDALINFHYCTLLQKEANLTRSQIL